MPKLINSMVAGIIKNLNESTNSGAIAYVPGGYTTMKQTISSLGGLKSSWKIDILEKDKDYDVSFEDKLKVIVPKVHYKHFNDNVIKIDGLKEVNLSKLLKEAVEANFESLLSALTTTLRKNSVIKKTIESMNAWLVVFPNSQFSQMSEKVLINLQRYDESVANIIKAVKKKHSEDRGYLETLISTIEENKPLNNVKIISSYDYLAGCRIETNYEDEKLTLDLFVNLSFHPTQTIAVTEPNLAMEIKHYRGVKVIKNILFPVGGYFSPSTFSVLKNEVVALNNQK